MIPRNTSMVLAIGATIVGLWSLVSCVQFGPYRTQGPDTRIECHSDAKGKLSPHDACKSAAWEADPDYDLFFAEFDDQGLVHLNDESGVGHAGGQIDAIDLALRGTRFHDQPINLIVYVHGWKHDAKSDDEDVEAFRRLLQSIRALEDVSDETFGIPGVPTDAHARQVVGVYVGWRGLSTTLEPLKELSFWGRKEAATRVAMGSARELFSRLWAFQRMRNAEWDKSKLAGGEPALSSLEPIRDPTVRPPVQMLIVGHSFGAQLVYGALEENLIEAVAAHLSDSDARIRRYGDMVVLINPAFEATRYLPLLRVARARKYDHYLAPLLVTVTTSNDWATGEAFPFGRWMGSRFEHYSSKMEQRDALNTPGNLDELITHNLRLESDEEERACQDWQVPTVDEQAKRILRDDIKKENEAAAKFFNARRSIVDGMPRVVLPAQWSRHFCGGMTLKFGDATAANNAVDPDMPIWNIKTDPPIVDGHNDFKTPQFFAFVRQLRADSVTYWAIKATSDDAGVTASNR